VAGKLPDHQTEVAARLLNNAKKGETVMGLEKVLDDIKREGRKEGFARGVEKGLEKGMEKGTVSAKETVARNLMRMGMDDAAIAHATGFEPERVTAIRQQLSREGSN